jgi:hypothetical protein
LTIATSSAAWAIDTLLEVLGELVAQRLSAFILGLAVITVGGSKASEIRDGLKIPDQNACHVMSAFRLSVRSLILPELNFLMLSLQI